MEEGFAAEREAQPRAFLLNCANAVDQNVAAALSRLTTAGGYGADHADRARFDHRVGKPALIKVAWRGDDAGLNLAGATALTDDEIAQQPFVRAAVISLQPHLLADLKRRFADSVAGLGGQQAVIHRQDPRPRTGSMEAAAERAVLFNSKRELKLVAVAPLFDRRNDRFELKAVELADPP